MNNNSIFPSQVQVLQAGVVYIRVYHNNSTEQTEPVTHALTPNAEWQPHLATLAYLDGYVSLLLHDVERDQGTRQVAEIDIGELIQQDIGVDDRSLFGRSSGFHINLSPGCASFDFSQPLHRPVIRHTRSLVIEPLGCPDNTASRRSASNPNIGDIVSHLYPLNHTYVPTTLYLAATHAASRNQWLARLWQHSRQCLSAPIITATLPLDVNRPISFRVCRSLWVKLSAVNQPDLHALVYQSDGQPLALVDLERPTEYFGTNLPALITQEGILISVYRSKPNKREAGYQLGVCRLPLSTMERSKTYNGWYPLSHGQPTPIGSYLPWASHVRPSNRRRKRPTIGKTCPSSLPFRSGDLHVQSRYEEIIVLASPLYAGVVAQLNSLVVYQLCRHLPAASEGWLVETLTKIMVANGTSVDWIDRLIRYELTDQPDPQLMFRKSTVATRAMDTLMKVMGMEFAQQTLGRVVQEVVMGQYRCEVDPARIDEAYEDLDEYWQELTELLERMWEDIENNWKACSPLLRQVLGAIRLAVVTRYPGDHQLRYACVSSFVFLRLLCPAMLSPRSYGLVDQAPSPMVMRTLTLMAKGIQCMANLSDCSLKEPYMQPMNQMVQRYIPRLKLFMDRISEDPEEDAQEPAAIDRDRELAVLCQFLTDSQDLLATTSSSSSISSHEHLPPALNQLPHLLHELRHIHQLTQECLFI